jgi:rhodanese-related sulfurtransferase
MRRFDSRIAAGVLVGLGGAYLVAVLVTGRTARAEVPPDLAPRAADAALDVWKTAALLVQEPRAAVLDVRPAEAYERYHLPRAVSVAGASAAAVAEHLRSAPAVVVYAGNDEVARKLVAEVRGVAKDARVHYVVDGARAWYLAFQLPVPLFADTSPPAGYAEALRIVQTWFASGNGGDGTSTIEALQVLARANYQPTLLTSGKRSASAGGGKKRISGGCG